MRCFTLRVHLLLYSFSKIKNKSKRWLIAVGNKSIKFNNFSDGSKHDLKKFMLTQIIVGQALEFLSKMVDSFKTVPLKPTHDLGEESTLDQNKIETVRDLFNCVVRGLVYEEQTSSSEVPRIMILSESNKLYPGVLCRNRK